MPPQTGKETETFNPVLSRYTQPYLATLVNHGTYRIQYTGDITLFNDDFLEYQLVGLTDEARLHDDFALIVDIKFLKAVNLAFYYEGRQVTQSPRRDKVTLDADAGTNYHDPVSKILSFVVKGTVSPVRIRQLDVVSVAFGVVSTFDSFFEDNFIDPNAIDAAFADMVPPTYAANYDPDNGNIVKSNTFVRNLASVLNINPARIRVVNIVPGNRRRLKELAEKDPKKWKKLYERKLDEADDEGLGVDFEIAAVNPCEDVVCEHGVCNGDGVCECSEGYQGSTCNVSYTYVNCSLPNTNCSDPTLAPTYSPSFAPTSLPTYGPSMLPTSSPSSVPSPSPTNSQMPSTTTPHPTPVPSLKPTDAPVFAPSPVPTSSPVVAATGAFAELISVATTLVESANDGTLDTGYTVTSATVVYPDDECGVPGGDSSTCDDACGVINGDNSTCADTCGVPNGDGTSCIDTSGGFYTCDHAESNGIMNERHAILIRGVNMLGLYSLSFNGETTTEMSVYSSSETILEALTALNTIGNLLITTNLTEASTGAGLAAIDIFVEFDRETGTYPYHYGKQPLIQVNSNSTLGDVTFAEASRVCEGTYRTGYSFEEQEVIVNTTVYVNSTTFKLMYNSTGEYKGAYGITDDIPVTASSYEFTTSFAAMTWYGLPADTVYELDESHYEVFVNGTASWIIRFYFAPNDDGLRTTVLGDVPLLLDSKQQKNVTVGTEYDSYRLSIKQLLMGVVPESVMPVSATATGAASGESDVEDAEDVEESSVDVTEVVHECGDSSRTSIEGCDDGNLIENDGCSTNCTVELGYVCTDSIGETSVCSVPVNPTLYFEATSFGPYAEGGKSYATVRRTGSNSTVISVSYTVSGSTAVASVSENDDCATMGDFNNTGGIAIFNVGVDAVDIEVDLYEDGIWEQALSTYEKFVISLVSSDDADIDSTRSTTKVEIEDLDSSEYTLGYCVTVEPSFAPTAQPTHVPSMYPTYPTMSPTERWYGLIIEASTSAALADISYNSSSQSISDVFGDDQKTLFMNSLADSVALVSDTSEVNLTDVYETQSSRRRRRLQGSSSSSLSVSYTLTITTSLDYTEDELVSDLTDQLTAIFTSVYNATSNTSTSIFAKALASYSTSLGIPLTFDIDSTSTLDLVSSLTYVVVRSSTYTPTSMPTSSPTGNGGAGGGVAKGGFTLFLLLIILAIAVGIILVLVCIGLYFKRYKKGAKLLFDETENDENEKSLHQKTIERLASYDYSKDIPIVTRFNTLSSVNSGEEDMDQHRILSMESDLNSPVSNERPARLSFSNSFSGSFFSKKTPSETVTTLESPTSIETPKSGTVDASPREALYKKYRKSSSRNMLVKGTSIAEGAEGKPEKKKVEPLTTQGRYHQFVVKNRVIRSKEPQPKWTKEKAIQAKKQLELQKLEKKRQSLAAEEEEEARENNQSSQEVPDTEVSLKDEDNTSISSSSQKNLVSPKTTENIDKESRLSARKSRSTPVRNNTQVSPQFRPSARESSKSPSSRSSPRTTSGPSSPPTSKNNGKVAAEGGEESFSPKTMPPTAKSPTRKVKPPPKNEGASVDGPLRSVNSFEVEVEL